MVYYSQVSRNIKSLDGADENPLMTDVVTRTIAEINTHMTQNREGCIDIPKNELGNLCRIIKSPSHPVQQLPGHHYVQITNGTVILTVRSSPIDSRYIK